MSISEAFSNELNRISNIDIRNLVVHVIDNRVPSEIWDMKSSSSGKFHPLDKNGEPETILQHTKSVYRVLHCIMEHPMVKDDVLDSRVRDLLRAAALLHDSVKYGYPNFNEHTVFEHPILIKSLIDDLILNNEVWSNYFDEICNLIGSHHGPWRTSSYANFALPQISSDAQWYLHLADYIASREYIRVDYDALV